MMRTKALCCVLSAMKVVVMANRNATKYGGADKPWALILLYLILARMVGRKNGRLKQSVLPNFEQQR